MLTCPICKAEFREGRVHTGFDPSPHTCETHPESPTELHVTVQAEGRIERQRRMAREEKKNG